MQRFFFRLLATAAAVLLASYLFPNMITVAEPMFVNALLFALLLGLLNAFLRPILLLLTLPLNLITLGLFTLVINAIVFWIATKIPIEQLQFGVRVADFGAAFIAALLVSVVSFIASRVLT